MLSGRRSRIDVVIRLRVNEHELLERIAKRFSEQGRADDNPDTYAVRLKAYNDQTAPLLPYYAAQGKLVEVDGMGAVDVVASEIDHALSTAPLAPRPRRAG